MSILQLASQRLLRLSRSQLSLHHFVKNSNRSLTTSQNPPPEESLDKTLKGTTVERKEWQPIYKFSLIQSLVTFNRLKVYQFGLTALVLPVSFAIPAYLDPLIVTSVGLSGAATLTLASFAFKNMIGFIYTKPTDPDVVKFAYATFWGGRKDVEMKIDDVVPFSQLPRTVLDSKISVLKFKNGQSNMKLVYKFGGVIDYNEFTRVFGEDVT